MNLNEMKNTEIELINNNNEDTKLNNNVNYKYMSK